MVRILITSAVVASSVLTGGCEREARQSNPESHSGARRSPVLSASPNPIPAGDPDQPTATTQITWNTGDRRMGELYVKIDREDEHLVGRGPSGVMKIDWIQFDSRYEFRLYSEERSRILARLTVTRED